MKHGILFYEILIVSVCTERLFSVASEEEQGVTDPEGFCMVFEHLANSVFHGRCSIVTKQG